MDNLLLLCELILGFDGVCLDGLEAVLLQVRVVNELTKQELGAAQIRLGLLDESRAHLRICNTFGAGDSLVEHGLEDALVHGFGRCRRLGNHQIDEIILREHLLASWTVGMILEMIVGAACSG